jgi:hypothetical protein
MTHPLSSRKRLVNVLEHPAYNTWTLREKLAMPQVRYAIAKFSISSIFLGLLLSLYFALSICIIMAIPVFHSEHKALVEEQWKAHTGCLPAPATGMVILKCADADFSINQDTILHETVVRTMSQLTSSYASMQFLLYDFLGCQLEDGRCRALVVGTMSELMHNPVTVFSLSWLSGTLTLLACVLTYGPAPHYFRSMRKQLEQRNAEGVKFATMSPRDQSAYMHALASPEDNYCATAQTQPFFPPQLHQWTPFDEMEATRAMHEQEEEQESIEGLIGLRSRPTVTRAGAGAGAGSSMDASSTMPRRASLEH